MAKRKRKKSSNTAVTVIITAAVVAALFIFVPKLVHQCDHCNQYFFGTGYEPNVLSGTLDNEEIICEKCAKEEYQLFGIKLDEIEEHKIPLFPAKEAE